MEKVINGQVYKEVKIDKLIINGKEKSGCIISAEENNGEDELIVTIVTESSAKSE
ncbi:hypothetical protein [Clostridium sp.]|uniref:hypothetical protein n=1 Tax=Clostridium sp. TaxID=1506 RepID=UPI00284DDC3D|nr:hypothetical protein [Clostridium sp.]MDR3594084.1 hypothetical protein [Clostridium sp.]